MAWPFLSKLLHPSDLLPFPATKMCLYMSSVEVVHCKQMLTSRTNFDRQITTVDSDQTVSSRSYKRGIFRGMFSYVEVRIVIFGVGDV